MTDTILYGTDVLGFKTPQEPGDDTWNLFTIKPDGTGLKQITDVPAGSRLWEASWTPDGTRIIADWESNRIGVFVDPADRCHHDDQRDDRDDPPGASADALRDARQPWDTLRLLSISLPYGEHRHPWEDEMTVRQMDHSILRIAGRR